MGNSKKRAAAQQADTVSSADPVKRWQSFDVATLKERPAVIDAGLTKKSEDDLIAFLHDPDNRSVARPLLADFDSFTILKIECDDGFYWEMKLKTSRYLEKVYHRYNVFFAHNPKPYYDDIDRLERDIKEIQSDVQMALVEDEREEKIDRVKKSIEHEKRKLIEERMNCPEINFEGVVSGNEWKEGTILKISVPAPIVNRLNDQRSFIECYEVRLEKIGD